MNKKSNAGYEEDKKRQAKTREQFAEEYGILVKTLKKWIKDSGVELPTGVISPAWIERIFQLFGHPK